jgi:asparagine synthase (glutamine-hydrolysing)
MRASNTRSASEGFIRDHLNSVAKPMPGLVGFVARSEVNGGLLDQMVQPLRHQQRYLIDKSETPRFGLARVHLGHYNPAPQPKRSTDGGITVFIDGKIYGYRARADELRNNGYQIGEDDDAGFCLASYQDAGLGFIKRLNGNFVICIHDENRDKTVFANDRFGFRVHYYATIGDCLLFAPEPKSILSVQGFKKELNNEGVAQFLALGEFWDTTTLFKGINVLPPATILTCDGGEVRTETYWRLTYQADYTKSEDDLVEELVSKFRKAIAIRMDDHLRHGVTLSGGLDSRCQIGGMSPEARSFVTACTFGTPDSDEAKIAHRVATTEGLKGHIIEAPTPSMITSNAAEDVRLTDGRLYMGLSFVYPIFDSFRKEVDVIFDGFAMDLTLGGSYLTKQKMSLKTMSELKPILRTKRRFDDAELARLLAPEFYQMVAKLPDEAFNRLLTGLTSDDPRNAADEFAMNGHVVWMHIGDVAVRSQVEVSHPSSDSDFFDLLTTIPPELRYDHRIYRKFIKRLAPELARIPYDRTMVRADAPLFAWHLGRKYMVYKEALKKRLQIVTRNRIFLSNKRSYVAFNEWFRSDRQWQEYFTRLLLEDADLTKGILNQERVRTMLEEQLKGEKDHSVNLIHLATLKLFLRTYVPEGP